jgi:hypothetical protein
MPENLQRILDNDPSLADFGPTGPDDVIDEPSGQRLGSRRLDRRGCTALARQPRLPRPAKRLV